MLSFSDEIDPEETRELRAIASRSFWIERVDVPAELRPSFVISRVAWGPDPDRRDFSFIEDDATLVRTGEPVLLFVRNVTTVRRRFRAIVSGRMKPEEDT